MPYVKKVFSSLTLKHHGLAKKKRHCQINCLYFSSECFYKSIVFKKLYKLVSIIFKEKINNSQSLDFDLCILQVDEFTFSRAGEFISHGFRQLLSIFVNGIALKIKEVSILKSCCRITKARISQYVECLLAMSFLKMVFYYF